MATTMTKAQFNVTSAKAFRATIAKYDDARVDIAMEIQRRNDRVASIRGMIATNGDRIEKLDAVKEAHKIADIEAESAKFSAEIDTLNAELSDYKKAQASRLAGGLALVTEDLYKAYSAYTVDAENGDLREALCLAVEKFLTDNGVVSGVMTVEALVSTMGNKGNGYGGKNGEYATGKCVRAKTKDTFTKDFLVNLISIMRSVNALPAKKYSYVPVKMRNK